LTRPRTEQKEVFFLPASGACSWEGTVTKP